MKVWRRLCALALAVCLLVLPVAAADAVEEPDLRALLNRTELHPQRTGYPKYDRMLEEILAPYEQSDTYTKVRAAYDWTIQNVDFSWRPYSQNWAPAYDCFAQTHTLAYEEGLQEVIPWEIVNRSYHAATAHEGVCYDYASLFVVLSRFIGIEAYVHTGYFTFETGYGNGAGHHGWAELCIDGENYIFDPQRDYRMSASGTVTITYDYFGIPAENAWRYAPDSEANAARDAEFVPVTAARTYRPVIRVHSTASGTASGTCTAELGAQVTVRAVGADFVGWFTENGVLCSTDAVYRFTARKSMELLAVFSEDFFMDLRNSVWYYKEVSENGKRWIVNRVALTAFDSPAPLTVTAAKTMLACTVSADGEAQKTMLVNLPTETWFTDGVVWAKRLQRSTGSTAQADSVTLEQFVTLLIRYAEANGNLPAPSPLDGAAQVDAFALDAMQRAQTAGLLDGFDTLSPQDPLTSAQGLELLLRLLDWMGT